MVVIPEYMVVVPGPVNRSGLGTDGYLNTEAIAQGFVSLLLPHAQSLSLCFIKRNSGTHSRVLGHVGLRPTAGACKLVLLATVYSTLH